MPVETNHVRRDHVELAAEIGQWLISFDPPDHALHAEQVDHLSEAVRFIEVHAEDVVAEVLADVEEVAGAASDIEHALPPAEVEPELANAFQINFHPRLDLEILRPFVSRILHGVAIVNFLELLAVDGRGDLRRVEAQRRAADQPLLDVPARARVGVAAQNFLKFVG